MATADDDQRRYHVEMWQAASKGVHAAMARVAEVQPNLGPAADGTPPVWDVDQRRAVQQLGWHLMQLHSTHAAWLDYLAQHPDADEFTDR